MRLFRPALPLLLALLLSITFPVTAEAAPDTPDWSTLVTSGKLDESATEGTAAILVDANTGQVLFEKNADVKKYPASITKIMTCLLTLENCSLGDMVTVGDLGEFEARATKIGIKKGDLIPVEELLYALMLASGNDAGVALAQYISGSVEEFATLMNAKCAELGMSDTHFVNPHGLHDDNHYTTARDMAKLTMEARKYPEFATIVSTAYHTVKNTNADFEGVNEWANTNRLIIPNNEYTYEFATGVKTGYTSTAQHTLVASAKKDDFELIAVVLEDSKDGKWTDVITMFLYGYDFYDTINLTELLIQQTLDVNIENAANNGGRLALTMVADSESYYTGQKDEVARLRANPNQFQMQAAYHVPLVAPISKDTLVGTATFSLDGGVVMTCKLYAANSIEPIPTNTPEPTRASVLPVPDTGTKLGDYQVYLFGGLVALLVLILMITVLRRRSASKSKKHAKRYSSDRSRRRR